MPHRRDVLIGGVAAALAAGPAAAHHGWRWAEDEVTEVAGTITEVRLGNPHGIVWLDAGGEVWEVEVGQPWRNHGAGLTDDLLVSGTEMRVEGNRAADPDQRLIKAIRVYIGGMRYTLYPDR